MVLHVLEAWAGKPPKRWADEITEPAVCEKHVTGRFGDTLGRPMSCSVRHLGEMMMLLEV